MADLFYGKTLAWAQAKKRSLPMVYPKFSHKNSCRLLKRLVKTKSPKPFLFPKYPGKREGLAPRKSQIATAIRNTKAVAPMCS